MNLLDVACKNMHGNPDLMDDMRVVDLMVQPFIHL